MTARRETASKIGLLGFVTLFVLFFSRPYGQNRVLALGDQVPEFTLRDADGQVVVLADFRGKIAVVNFWATWCPPCIEEMPSLNRLAEQYADKGVEVVAISVDEDPDAYREFLAKNEIKFLTLRDPSRRISEQYGTYKLPESYIVSRDGRLLNKIIGAADWTSSAMLSYFEGLLASSQP
ncbi:MAG: TlpA family protein disulfide reductase [Acidobacteria bacterium]|nr:TlpA family protein disulfide reductase [Acidobacteriota bacterium]